MSKTKHLECRVSNTGLSVGLSSLNGLACALLMKISQQVVLELIIGDQLKIVRLSWWWILGL